MKRSEMIQEIISRFYSDDDTSFLNIEEADSLLSIVEELGMLPPYSNPDDIRGYDLIYANPEKLHQWEKE